MALNVGQVIRRECSVGVQCTRMQSQVVAHCIKDCMDCNRESVASVLGTCAIEGHESAMNLVRATCDHTDNDDELGDMFAELGPAPPPPPPCTMLQTAIAEGCVENCGEYSTLAVFQPGHLSLNVLTHLRGHSLGQLAVTVHLWISSSATALTNRLSNLISTCLIRHADLQNTSS